MKRKFVSALAIAMACSMAFSLTSTASSPKPSASAAPAAAESLYPITKDGSITLSYWVKLNSYAAQYIRDYTENESFQEAMKDTGVKLKFIHPPVGQERESFNLMIASKDIPDIMDIDDNMYPGGEAQGVADGVFLNLTPYLQKYAPDYYKLVNADDEIKRETRTTDGVYPAFYAIKPYKDPVLQRLQFRTDIMKELGITKTPAVLSEFETLFEAAKTKKNIASFILDKNGRNRMWMGAHDIVPGFYRKDNKIQFGEYRPEYKNYLTLMNKWFQAGYIAKDFPSLTQQQRVTKYDQGQGIMVYDGTDSYSSRTTDLGIKSEPGPAPRLKAGDKLHYNDQDAWPRRTNNNGVIFSKTRFPIEAIKFMNYGYTDKGLKAYNFGVEGKAWKMVDGKPTFQEYIYKNPKFGVEPANYIIKYFNGPKYQLPSIECGPLYSLSPDFYKVRIMYNDDPDFDSAYVMPPYQVIGKDNERLAKIMADVNTYVDEMTLKFIIGGAPLSDFDKYIAQLKTYGIEEAIAIRQKAYDAYMAIK